MVGVLVAIMVTLQAVPPGIRTIAHDGMSGINRPREAVARTAEEWATLWRAHAADTPVPPVDFATTIVAAVFLGERMTAGYQVEIIGTRVDGGALVVQWSERIPARDRIAAQIITSPAHIVAIPRFAGEIRFEKVDR